jgi:CHAP domain
VARDRRRPGSAARLLAALACATALAAAAPSPASAADALRWEPSATLFWTVNQQAIIDLFQNGECTEWAADKRPDVLQQMIRHMIAVDLDQRQDEIITGLDARYWATQASAAGIATGRKPAAGALIVFQPDTLYAEGDGHIAYVERVLKGGKLRISEMHTPNPYQVTYRTLPANTARLAGVRFIY